MPVLIEYVVCDGMQPDGVAVGVLRVGFGVAAGEEPCARQRFAFWVASIKGPFFRYQNMVVKILIGIVVWIGGVCLLGWMIDIILSR